MNYHNIYKDTTHSSFKENVIRTKQVGTWIIAFERVGYALDLKIYNALTGEEHYKLFHQVEEATSKMSPEVFDFYKKAEDWEFNHACELAEKW